MAEAYLPFLKYIVLQFAVGIVGLNVVRDREINFNGLLKCWIFGQMLCFAVLQVMAVPMILMRLQFIVLFWSYLGVMIVLFGFGAWGLKSRKIRISIHKGQWTGLAIVLTVIAVILILWQSGNYFFGMHLDEDDARWLAEANDALEYGDMMIRDFDSGNYLYSFVKYEDIPSPWPMMYAVSSKLIFTSTSIFSHTIYAPIELILMYCIYWLIGSKLFVKIETKLSFLLLSIVSNMFLGGSIYTGSVFSLIRIWQGKASVAAIVIPLLLYLFICINRDGRKRDWIAVIVTTCAACLMSGMGIFISALIDAVYGFYTVIAYKRWRTIPLFICSLLPSIVFAIVHLYVKG